MLGGLTAGLARDDLAGVAGLVAAGGVVSALCAWVPAELPWWLPYQFSWVAWLGTAGALWLYARGLRRTTAAERPSRRRRGLFVLGVALIYAVLQTRFDYAAQHMFTLTRVQHLVTHHLGPFLIALSWPGATLQRGAPAPLRRLLATTGLRRLVAWVQHPVPACVLFVGLIFFWLLPPVHFPAMIDRRLYGLMNLTMVVDGVLFWCLVMDPRPAPPAPLSRGVRLLLVFAVQWPQVAGGALIGFVGTSLYPYYTLCGRVLPQVGEQSDQELGGFLIWFGGGMMSTVAALVLLRALRAQDRVAEPPQAASLAGL